MEQVEREEKILEQKVKENGGYCVCTEYNEEDYVDCPMDRFCGYGGCQCPSEHMKCKTCGGSFDCGTLNSDFDLDEYLKDHYKFIPSSSICMMNGLCGTACDLRYHIKFLNTDTPKGMVKVCEWCIWVMDLQLEKALVLGDVSTLDYNGEDFEGLFTDIFLDDGWDL